MQTTGQGTFYRTHPGVQAWRDRYNITATSDSWLESHHWLHGQEAARAAAGDVREKFKLQPTDTVVEVGAGTGGFLASVLYPGQQGLALDFCHAMIKKGAQSRECRHLQHAVSEAAQLPIPDSSFEKVLCYGVTQHFPDMPYARACLNELMRICRPGGIVLIGDISGVLETPRRLLVACHVPAPLIRVLLSGLKPLRWLRRASKGMEHSRYAREFFLRAFPPKSGRVEILEKSIPGWHAADSRFDVRFWKSAFA